MPIAERRRARLRALAFALAAAAVGLMLARSACGPPEPPVPAIPPPREQPTDRPQRAALPRTSEPAPEPETAAPPRPDAPDARLRCIDVRDLATGEPVSGCAVTVAEFARSGTVDVITGSDGRIPLDVPAGREPATADFAIPRPFRLAGVLPSDGPCMWSLWLYREIAIHVNVVVPRSSPTPR